jgi:MOSC domain-containing protein YiiM
MTDNPTIAAISVNTGRIQPLRVGNRQMLSAIGKKPQAGAVIVHALGPDGDQQANLDVHGGPERAVYAYPIAHYEFWHEQRRLHTASLFDEALSPGFMGENLTVTGPLEDAIFVGDILQFPHCSLRVTAPREPCSKFTAIMGFGQAAKAMVHAGCCGYYLAVEKLGHISAGEAATLVAGPRKTSILQAFRAIFPLS